MNISSVIINLKDESFLNSVLLSLRDVLDCEIVANEGAKIVAVITADSVDGEIKKFRELEAINGVSSVVMVYAYQEDIEFDKDKLEISSGISEILTNENLKAEDIVYNGHVGFKVNKWVNNSLIFLNL